MLKKVNKLILDHIPAKGTGKKGIAPISEGLMIKKENTESITDIAYIFWDEAINNCYIKTVADNFQNNIVIYDDFKDFIQLIDEAYYLINLTNKKEG